VSHCGGLRGRWNYMTVTAEHIYNKICEKCDRPALTFDRKNRAMCPRHARIFVRAQPVANEIPVVTSRN
jgi:hypothetical protein